METKGLVVKAISSFFYVKYQNEIIECRASKKLKLNKQKILTGDYVLFDEETCYINQIVERKNELIRPKIANVENAVLVFSATEPDMNFGLLDRMILIMELNNLKSHILITKTDLLNDDEKNLLFSDLSYYQEIGYPVFDSNSINDCEEFIDILNKQKFVFTGQTGVGKSTFINKILPELDLETQPISKALGRGKHTTREVTFYEFNDSYIIDTPGFSALEIPFTAGNVRDNYVDFVSLSSDCKFNTCYHDEEPNCAVKNYISNAPQVVKNRYNNYIKLLKELGDFR